MGFFSDLFKKPEAPQPYDWAFLKEKCLLAIDTHVVSPKSAIAHIGQLDEGRLSVSGPGAEDVVDEIWAVLKDAKLPGLSPIQAQEYLYYAAEMLRTDIDPETAAARLKDIEERIRKK